MESFFKKNTNWTKGKQKSIIAEDFEK